MALLDIDIRRVAAATPTQVWRLLGDSTTWPDWTPIGSVEILERGDTAGVGEVRRFQTGRVTVREQVVERQEAQRLSYTLLGGLAVRDYRADIELKAVDGGTEIRWHTTFKAKVPGSGWLYHRALTKATKDFVDGLIEHAPAQIP